MKKILLVICLVNFNFLVAQQITTDSLFRKIKHSKKDTEMVNMLIGLSARLRNSNTDTAMIIAKDAMNLSENLQWTKGIGKCHNEIGVIYRRIGNYALASEAFKKSLDIWNNENLWPRNDKGVEKARNELKGVVNGNIANLNVNTGDYGKALEYFKISMGYYELAGTKKGIAQTLGNMGIVYYQQGDYVKALEVFFKALSKNEEIKNENEIARILSNIGLTYASQKEYSKAKEYYSKALKLAESLNYKSLVGNIATNTGLLYFLIDSNTRALTYYSKALRISKDLNNPVEEAKLLGNMAGCYKDQGDSALRKENRSYALNNRYPKALEFFELSLKKAKEIGDKQGVTVTLQNIGALYIPMKKYQQAEEYLTQSLNYAKEMGLINEEKYAYDFFHDLYRDWGKYAEALEAYHKFVQIKDTIFSEENIKQVAEQEMRYTFDKKNLADSLKIAEEKRISDLQLKQEKTQKYALYAGLALVLVFGITMLNRFKVTQKQKLVIESKERETHAQKELIEEKQKEMLDSITYARRIQRALLASDELLDKSLPERFIFFKPKDIVSGDFYWAVEHDGLFYMVIADSTGHGVPGAFMSLLNISFLNESITEKNITNPAAILDHTRKRLIKALKGDGSEEGGKDGMDCIVTVFDFKNNLLKYAAANNSFYMVRDKQLLFCQADKMPVGRSPKDDEPFSQKEIHLQKGDIIYLLTDGMPDQFGGPKGKKYKYRQLEELMLSNSHLPMPDQRRALEKSLEEWKGPLEQVDDICIAGIKI